MAGSGIIQAEAEESEWGERLGLEGGMSGSLDVLTPKHVAHRAEGGSADVRGMKSRSPYGQPHLAVHDDDGTLCVSSAGTWIEPVVTFSANVNNGLKMACCSAVTVCSSRRRSWAWELEEGWGWDWSSKARMADDTRGATEVSVQR